MDALCLFYNLMVKIGNNNRLSVDLIMISSCISTILLLMDKYNMRSFQGIFVLLISTTQ